jgi:predicted HTH domain antitoxin
MGTATISIEVGAEAARAFGEASAEEQRKLELLLSLRLRELTTGPARSLKEVMDEIGAKAQARGLTAEVLNSLLISGDTLRAAGMDERATKLEIACRWFDTGKLSFGYAARFAGLNETDFDAQLELRGIPRYRYTEEMLEQDVETLKKLGRW